MTAALREAMQIAGLRQENARAWSVVDQLTTALKALVENIDGGVTPETFKKCELDNPEMSSLRYAREVLASRRGPKSAVG